MVPLTASGVDDANNNIITKQVLSSQYIKSSLSSIFRTNDYNPPHYQNLSSDSSSQLERTQMLLKNISSQLNTNSNGNSSSGSSSNDYSSASSSSLLSDINIITKKFTKDTIDIGVWFVSFSNLR